MNSAIAVGLVILVTDGQVTIRVIRPNAKENSYIPIPQPEGKTIAGAICYGDSSPPGPAEQHGVTMNVILHYEDDIAICNNHASSEITSIKHVPDLVSFGAWNAQLNAWGVQWNGEKQYAKDGQFTTEVEVPFYFLPGLLAVVVIHPEQPTHYLVLQECHDTQNWKNVFKIGRAHV